MWRLNTRIATAILSATLALVAANDARAAAVQTYSYTTTGTVGAPAFALGPVSSGPSVGPIGFDGVSAGTMTTPGAFNLGAFTVSALPASASLTYDNTAFVILLTGFGTDYTFRIDGVLNGTLDGSGNSNLVASVTSVAGFSALGSTGEAPFPLTDIRIIAPQVIAAPINSQGSRTAFLGQVGPNINPPAVPEPASFAVVAVGLVAWGLNRRRRPAA